MDDQDDDRGGFDRDEIDREGIDLHLEYERARLYADVDRPAEAARILVTLLDAEPGNDDVRMRLALAYFRSAQLRQAEEQLRALVERDPADHYAHHVLGRALERMSRHAEALPHLRLASAMHLDPDYRAAVERVLGRLSRE